MEARTAGGGNGSRVAVSLGPTVSEAGFALERQLTVPVLVVVEAVRDGGLGSKRSWIARRESIGTEGLHIQVIGVPSGVDTEAYHHHVPRTRFRGG